MEVQQRSHDNESGLHRTEIERLQINIKDREVIICELRDEVKNKCEENGRVKLDNGAKEAELFRVIRENNDVKQMVDFKTGENEKLRAVLILETGFTGQTKFVKNYSGQKKRKDLKKNKKP